MPPVLECWGTNMTNLIVTLLGFVVIFALLLGILCTITGEGNKGNQIIINCTTVLALYLLIVQLFNVGITQNSFFVSGIPLIKGVNQYGSIQGLFSDAPGIFAFDFVELVILTLIINWISNLFSLSESGFVGKILSRIVIVKVESEKIEMDIINSTSVGAKHPFDTLTNFPIRISA